MNVKRTVAAVALSGALVAGTTACEVEDDCRSSSMYIFVVGGVYHVGSPTGRVIPAKHVDPKTGKLKPGVSLSKDGKVSVSKPGGGSKGNGGGTVKAPSAPRAGGRR